MTPFTPSQRPKAVVFDLGKVLVDFDYEIASTKIAGRSRMSAVDIRRLIDHSPLLFRYETGLINRDQFFDEVREATGFQGSLEEYSRYFCDIFTPIEPMVELHAELRAKGVPTFIFSNTNDLAVGHIRAEFPFFSRFDGYVLSFEHGAMKPNARLYEVVERTTGLNNADILYLDDRLENVEAGRARGWQVILQESPETTLDSLRSTGLLG